MGLRKKVSGVGRPPQNSNEPVEKPTPEEAKKKLTEAAKKRKPSIGPGMSSEERKKQAANKSKRQLKPSEEAELKALWESGEFTLKELAEKYNRNPEALSRYFTLNGVIKGSKAEEYAQSIRDRIFEEMLGDKMQTVKKIKAVKDDYLLRIDIVKKLAHNEIVKTQQAKLPLQNAMPNLRAIKEYLGILETCRSEEYELLGVIEYEQRIEQEDIPELLITELSNEEIETMRVQQRKLTEFEGSIDDDDEIEVIDEGI